jgi:hypothetical protein
MADVVKLGDKVKDRVTGLTGIVIARTDWLNGCIRMTVQPQELKDGKPVDSSCFDIEELVLLKAGAVSPKPEEKRTNGPMPSVSREGR